MEEGFVGEAFADGLDPVDIEALVETALLHRRGYEHDRWLVNGRSRAPVAIVLETDFHERTTRRLLLKVPVTEDAAGLAEVEWARHRRAYAEAPPKFAEAHLTELVGEPIRSGRRRFVTFQAIAGDDVESVEVLTVLLNSMLGKQSEETTVIACSSEHFARICGSVVSGVLEPWNGRPRTKRHGFTVAEFLGLHILNQLEPGGRLHTLSKDHIADHIEIDGEERPLVNPFALARGALFGDRRIVRGLVGRTHGDLHTDNVLVRVRPAIDAADFHLIDLALYEAEGPLTRDPAHLLLYVLARRMDVLSESQQEALLDYLVMPEESHAGLLPGWLVEMITSMDQAFLSWLEGSSLQPEWRRERLLSLVGCAMLFLGRKSTRSEDYPWFLRLAARAADGFAAMPGVPKPDPAAVPPAGAPPVWRPLPEPVPVVWLGDLVPPRSASRMAVELHLVPIPPVERLPVSRLTALKEPLVAAGREARLLSGDEEILLADPATVAGRSGSGLAMTTTGQRSAWTEAPSDGSSVLLDREELAGRVRTLLDALLRVDAPRPDGFAIALGIEAGGLLVSEPKPAGNEPGVARPRVSAALPRVLADETLTRHELARCGSAVVDELLERLMVAFRQSLDPR